MGFTSWLYSSRRTACNGSKPHLRTNNRFKNLFLQQFHTFGDTPCRVHNRTIQELDRRNSLKKLFALGLLKKLDERRHIGAHRSPYLYEFDKTNYEKVLEEGIVLVI